MTKNPFNRSNWTKFSSKFGNGAIFSLVLDNDDDDDVVDGGSGIEVTYFKLSSWRLNIRSGEQ